MFKGFCAGGKKYYITDYGAVNDGTTINTKAIQKAIDDAHEKNGGIVVFTKGKFLSGSLILKTGVELFFEEGSMLLGSTDPDDYIKLDIENAPVSPKTDDNSRLALVLAYQAKNISITGKGIIDGRGRELALVLDSLHLIGKRIDPRYSNRLSETVRPKIINFMACENVRISGITIQNSSCWVQTYELCRNLVIDSIKVISRAYWNNDGMDITDCKNARITNCDINAADDGICLKSYYTGYYNDSIYISNCKIRSSASAIKFGTASIGGFKNVVIENIKIKDTYRSAVAIECVDGGFIENINVSGIVAENTGNAIFIRLGHRSGKSPGYIKNIVLKNFKIQVSFGRPDIDYDMRGPELNFFHNQFPVVISGIPGHDVENISLENIAISYPGRASKGMAYIPLWRMDMVPEAIRDYPEYTMFGELPSWGYYIRHASGIKMKDIRLNLTDDDFRPAMIFADVKKLSMEKIEIPGKKKDQIILKYTKDAHFDQGTGLHIKQL
jgi:Glycosyl hydrolases family 28